MGVSQVFGRIARNSALRRVILAYAGFTVAEYGVWIGMLVYAYDQGGATTAGLVAIAQLVPAAIVAPLVAPIADRRSPVLLLAGGYAVQALGAVMTAIAIFTGSAPVWAYLGAVLASTAVSTTRPAQSALLPALTREPEELTGANVVIGWMESLGILLAGGVVGVLLTVSNIETVFAVCAAVLAVATLAVARLPVPAHQSDTPAISILGHLKAGLAETKRSPASRLLVALLVIEFIAGGALDVLFVVLAVDILQAGEAWTGYLNMAYGFGGLVLGALAAFFVGRRLGPVILTTALMLGLALGATAMTSDLVVAVVLLAVVGGSRALFEVAVRVLLQRAVPADLVARIFGLAEGLSTAGLAVGALLAPILVAVGGGRLALLCAAVLLPLAVLARAGLLWRLDQHARVPIVEISLLRSLPLFRMLPSQSIEGLAAALERQTYQAGEVIVREGDEGDLYYAIADGHVQVQRNARPLCDLGRGEGFGEIALLGAGLRTATATATAPTTVYALERDAFLTAVNGHVPTQRSVAAVVTELRTRDELRDGRPS